MDPSLCVLSSFLAEAAYRSGVTAPLDIIARRWVVSPVHLVKPTPTTTQRQHACSVCRAPTLSKPAQSAQLVLLGMPISTTPRRQYVRRALRGRTRGRAGRSARSARWGGRPTPRARLSALCASPASTRTRLALWCARRALWEPTRHTKVERSACCAWLDKRLLSSLPVSAQRACLGNTRARERQSAWTVCRALLTRIRMR